MDHPFRSAALGGFNKQDVLTFLEEQAKQTAQAQQQLQEQLEGNDWERFWVSAILSDQDFGVMTQKFREMAERFPIRWPPKDD